MQLESFVLTTMIKKRYSFIVSAFIHFVIITRFWEIPHLPLP